MKIIVGLGNPGADYAHTRHNAGWDAVTAAAERLGASNFQAKKDWKAEVAEARLGDEKLLLVHPLTFMNRSGEAVAAVASFYKCPMDRILIVHDEMDFPLGKLAFTSEGGAAGHNGVASIHEIFGTRHITRLRLGINRPFLPIKAEDFVLRRFEPDEQPAADHMFAMAAQAIQDWAAHGLDAAMNSWNGVKGG